MKRMLALAVSLAFGIAFAADEPKPEPKPKDLEQARAAIAGKDWARARELLAAAVARTPKSADAHNLYAYALRMAPEPQMDLVFRHYNEALRIEPTHLGAHEYLGEAYLMVGNLAKAREHLAILDQICAGSCEEYLKLKLAVANAEGQHAAK